MIRVRVEAVEGSAPRDAGAEMWVTSDQSAGSIGGGRMEWLAIEQARRMIQRGIPHDRMTLPLGPEIGQCCGGRVTLSLTKVAAMPRAHPPEVLIFGAGHTGRALYALLRHMPVQATLYDPRPEAVADIKGAVLTPLPETAIRAAAPGAAFVVMTHDHALDFLLTTEALARGDAAYVGLIGSATKRARFLRHAAQAGVDAARLTCPIGAGFSRDKRPEAIAAFVTAELMAVLPPPFVTAFCGRAP